MAATDAGSGTRNTLELDDDLDLVELQDALEAAFGMRFGDAEAAGCRTVGDIFEVIRRHVPRSGGDRTGCATAMAFHALKRELSGLGPGIPAALAPATCLRALPGLPARRLLARLARRSGLRLPRPDAGPVGQAGALVILAGFAGLLLAVLAAPRLWFVPVGAGLLGFGLVRIDLGRLPGDCRTLGGLARRAAGLNFAAFQARGAKARDGDLWDALVGVVLPFTSLPRAEIRPGTLILQKQPRSA